MEPIIPPVNEASRKFFFQRNIEESKPKFENPEYQELSEMSEASIIMEWNSCTKKQGHEGFFQLKDFQSDPERYCKESNLIPTEKTLKYIDTIANLTVRLKVEFVSHHRPELYRKLFEHRGTKHTFTGTGCVVHDVNESKHQCRCKKCMTNAKKNGMATVKTFSVYIATATHVLYDDEEAKEMTAELNYNDDDRQCIKRLYGVSISDRSVSGDACIVECVTCDQQLANVIKTNLESANLLYREFPRINEPIVVIISHPHGSFKRISFGECKNSQTKRDVLLSLTSLEYNTTTCPGSSGAPVLLMNDLCPLRRTKLVLLNSPAHSGVNSQGLNFSATASNPKFKIKSEKKLQEMEKEINQSGTQESGEVDIHTHLSSCKKNPGHAMFVPVDDFNISHLPEGCHDNNLVEIVKCLADLTVRVAVRMISTERPEFWTNTTQPYPFYDKRGSDVMTLGTGIILLIRQIEDVQQPLCTCHKCQDSDTPSKVHYHIYMKTATHVVFDDLEARDTTARTFYDGQDSPLVTLDGWHVVDRDIEGDTCYLKCVTCDVDLGEKLFKMTQHLWNIYETIEYKYKSEKLSIISSHPHGCPKQVSVGHVVEEITLAEGYDLKLTKHSYTTCTCPGSSGAAVFILSEGSTIFLEKYITHHVHSDALESGLNKCSWAADRLN
ncbi:unnamed protein product [Lymnaea stagnalis]|uniref:Uncharacterized protein n=1 Tax=Lymnaea stagnalis TaxID=6523 RepID=A0AAV2HU37_LYMST